MPFCCCSVIWECARKKMHECEEACVMCVWSKMNFKLDNLTDHQTILSHFSCFCCLFVFLCGGKVFGPHCITIKDALAWWPLGWTSALPVTLIINKQWISDSERMNHSVTGLFFIRKSQGNAPKSRDFLYILHSGHVSAVLWPQTGSDVCGFWLYSVCRAAIWSCINDDWGEFTGKRQWWLIKWKGFRGSGGTDWICIYRGNHILLQGLKNAAGSSIHCCHGEDSSIVSIATNVDVINMFALLIIDY